jgi:hypothetical protein
MATVRGVEGVSEKFNVRGICMLVKKIVRKRVTSSQKYVYKNKVGKKTFYWDTEVTIRPMGYRSDHTTDVSPTVPSYLMNNTHTCF